MTHIKGVNLTGRSRQVLPSGSSSNSAPSSSKAQFKPLESFLDNRGKFDNYDYHRAAGCYEYEYESDSESGDTEPESEDESHELKTAYRSDDYQNLFNLVTHRDKQGEGDHLAYAISACLLIYYLKISNYFGTGTARDADGELTESELLIAKLLYQFLEVGIV